MTPEAQRLAIAKAAGWKDIRPDGGNFVGHIEHFACWCSLPNYLTDLNAMHAAEMVLTTKQVDRYREYFHSAENYGMFFTAAQRAEAFLRTLNLWEAA